MYDEVKQPAGDPPRIAASSSRNVVNFSSACTTKRFPSPRCASATKLVPDRPGELTAESCCGEGTPEMRRQVCKSNRRVTFWVSTEFHRWGDTNVATGRNSQMSRVANSAALRRNDLTTGAIGYAQFYSRSHEVSDCEAKVTGTSLARCPHLQHGLHFNNRLSDTIKCSQPLQKNFSPESSTVSTQNIIQHLNDVQDAALHRRHPRLR